MQIDQCYLYTELNERANQLSRNANKWRCIPTCTYMMFVSEPQRTCSTINEAVGGVFLSDHQNLSSVVRAVKPDVKNELAMLMAAYTTSQQYQYTNIVDKCPGLNEIYALAQSCVVKENDNSNVFSLLAEKQFNK